MSDLDNFVEEVSDSTHLWYLKRLSGNDTLANNSHQAGPHISLQFLFRLLPDWEEQHDENKTCVVELTIESHGARRDAKVTWYNNKYRCGTRNEARMTNFGGRESPALDPENTGALALFAFASEESTGTLRCRMWICRSVADENHIEALVGPVEPGHAITWNPCDHSILNGNVNKSVASECWLDESEIPDVWFDKFPSGHDLLQVALSRMPAKSLDPDTRLLNRRLCEEQAFYSVEHAVELKHILAGFTDIDSFIAKAKSMIQRRMSRSGRSLELHVRQIFEEEGLEAGANFSWQARTEMGKKPDFIFPSIDAYNDPDFLKDKLRMLAVKTSCKDRWRQVINEADRIERKHLLTLQEGVSVNQFDEMLSEGIQLVVPKKNIRKFNSELRPKLFSFKDFIEEVRELG